MLRSRVQMLEVEVADKKATIAKLRAALAKQTEREREIEARGRTVAGDCWRIPFRTSCGAGVTNMNYEFNQL